VKPGHTASLTALRLDWPLVEGESSTGPGCPMLANARTVDAVALLSCNLTIRAPTRL
jgi:hypothetical protein